MARPRRWLLLVATPVVLATGVGAASAAPALGARHAATSETKRATQAPKSVTGSALTLPLDAAAYYWREQSESAPAVGVAPPSAPDTTVPAGDLAVAAANDTSGRPDKETYLRLDTSSILAVTPTLVELVVPLDTAPGTTQAYDTAAPPSLTACAVAGAFSESSSPQSFESKPKDACEVKSVGKFDAGKSTWTFDVTAIAARWVTSGFNSGVAILPTDPAATVPFQYVFGPRARIHAIARVSTRPTQLDAVSPPVAAPPSTTAAGPAAQPPAPADSAMLPTSSGVSAPAGSLQAPLIASSARSNPRLAPAAYGLRAEWQLPVAGGLAALVMLALCSLVTGADRRNRPRIV